MILNQSQKATRENLMMMRNLVLGPFAFIFSKSSAYLLSVGLRHKINHRAHSDGWLNFKQASVVSAYETEIDTETCVIVHWQMVWGF